MVNVILIFDLLILQSIELIYLSSPNCQKTEDTGLKHSLDIEEISF